MSIADQIGKRILAVRDSRDLSRKDVAARCRLSPRLSESFLSQLENKPKTNITFRRLENLTVALGVSLTDLVNEQISVQQLVSIVNLDAFCLENEISAAEKARLRSDVEAGTALFDSVENWASHYNTVTRHAARGAVTQMPRVAEPPGTYSTRKLPAPSRRNRPPKR